MKNYNTSLFSKCFYFIFFFFFLMISCRKSDSTTNSNQATVNTSKFFSEHPSPDINVNEVQSFVKKQESQYHFVDDLVGRIGFPYWNESLVYDSKKNKSVTITSQNILDYVITYVPFVRESQEKVNACLLVKMTASDTSFRILYDWQYASLILITSLIQFGMQKTCFICLAFLITGFLHSTNL